VGLDENLYFIPPTGLAWNSTQGTPDGTSQLPINNDGILMPFEQPGAPAGAGANVNIWSGTYTSALPDGNGSLNEFCVHISHPDINDTSSSSFSNLERPLVTGSGTMAYPAFRHALGFETDTNITKSLSTSLQTLSTQQLEYYPANSTSAFGINDNAYPNKLGFIDSDEFLCGKYSCGSYLFIAPTSHTAIQIEGSTQLAKKTLEFGQENAITVPLIFQMRAQDKLGFIGGWRNAGNLKNITYSKKIGIDIQVRNEDLFSLDVLVTGSYTKTSLVSPAYSQSNQTI